MSFPPLPISFGPTVGASVEQQPRVLMAEFGDGYIIRAGDGINVVRDVYSVTWDNLARDEAATLVAFFKERAGYQAFEWTAPGDETPRNWICQKWSRSHIDATIDTISASFTEVFDL